MDAIFGTVDDEPEMSFAEQRKLETEQRKFEELYSDDQALANLAVLRTDGVIQRIFITIDWLLIQFSFNSGITGSEVATP